MTTIVRNFDGTISSAPQYIETTYPNVFIDGDPFAAFPGHTLPLDAATMIEAWLADGLNDLPSEDNADPIDFLRTTFVSRGWWTDAPWGATGEAKDFLSALLMLKKFYLATLPPIGTKLTILRDTTSSGFVQGTEVTVADPAQTGSPYPFNGRGSLRGYTIESSSGIGEAGFGVSFIVTDGHGHSYINTGDVAGWWDTPEVPVAPVVEPERVYTRYQVQRAFELLSEVYQDAASSRSWCAEAEQVSRAVNSALEREGFGEDFRVGFRQKTVSVKVSGYLTVPFEMEVEVEVDFDARDSDIEDAALTAYNLDARSAREVLDSCRDGGPEFPDGDDLSFRFDRN